eukprot:UN08384
MLLYLQQHHYHVIFHQIIMQHVLVNLIEPYNDNIFVYAVADGVIVFFKLLNVSSIIRNAVRNVCGKCTSLKPSGDVYGNIIVSCEFNQLNSSNFCCLYVIISSRCSAIRFNASL